MLAHPQFTKSITASVSQLARYQIQRFRTKGRWLWLNKPDLMGLLRMDGERTYFQLPAQATAAGGKDEQR